MGYQGGGGGFGNPKERDITNVQLDVQNEIVSKNQASKEYCVAFKKDSFEIDSIETEKLKSGL